jgi:hypothetical protein
MSVFSVFDAGLFFGAPLSVSKTVVKLSRASKMYLNGFQATKSIDGNYVLMSVSKTVVKLSRASKMYLNGFQATKSIDGNYVLMSCLRLLTADRLRSCYTAVL